MEDDYGTSYYFRGAVTNNYVNFAGFYWRIIRVNGDGSVRLIYDGKTSAYANGTSSTDRYISTSAYNSSSSSGAYVGYMYGNTSGSTYNSLHANTNDSTIKGVLDTWYENNLKGTTYESYLGDAIFCNDRSIYTSDVYITTYNAYNRFYTNKSPQLICNQQHDAFTVNDTTYGNGDLNYPIGLITIDEVGLAGAVSNTDNSGYYLYIGSTYFWTMSPSIYNSIGPYPNVWNNYSAGAINFAYVTASYAVRPVINLKSDVLIKSGSGTYSSPFTVTL